MTEPYIEQLYVGLQRYGLDREQISEIIHEAQNHLVASGETPMEAFGPPDVYAEERVAAREKALGGEWQIRKFHGTAYDEMVILELAGKLGWELIAVATFGLHCRRPWDINEVRQWEYARPFGFNGDKIITAMIAEGWEPCGSWTPFHYFKRPLLSVE